MTKKKSKKNLIASDFRKETSFSDMINKGLNKALLELFEAVELDDTWGEFKLSIWRWNKYGPIALDNSRVVLEARENLEARGFKIIHIFTDDEKDLNVRISWKEDKSKLEDLKERLGL